ncbi:MAG: tetratricopeptide repeat protein, partial [Burkholderiales bacterium]|nr:tetratricopeptide repeat protein [Burkholderiales bacterium]
MTKHRSRIAAVLALLLLATTPALGDEYEEATRLLRQGRTAAALEKVDAAIASNRTDARPRFLKGLILTERNEIQAAIGVFTDLTRDFPSLPEPYNNLAVLYAAQGQYDQARQSLEMAIHTHPSYAVAHENLGDVYAKMASEAYDKALSLDRSNKTAKTKLSLIRELFSKAGSPVGPTTATAVNEAVPPPQPATTDVPRTRPSTPPPEAGPNQEAAVIAAVANWAQAWSEQDVGAYLSHYAADFIPPRG